jgi:ankyrin repeat protein
LWVFFFVLFCTMRCLVVLLFILVSTLPVLAQYSDDDPTSPLLAAVMANNLSEVKRLVESGESVNEQIRYEAQPIDVAVEKDFRPIALYLLSKGATSRGGFYDALKTGDVAWVKTLIGYKFFDDEAMIPAVEMKNLAMVKLLVEHGFPTDFQQKRRTGFFRKTYVSPLEIAYDGFNESGNSTAIILELVKGGVPVTEAFYSAAVFEYNELGRQLIDQCKQTNNLLLECAKAGNVLLLNYCLSKGADKQSKTVSGENILLLAALNGRLELYKQCILLGISPNSLTATNENALMLSFRSENMALVAELLSANQNVEFQNSTGETALFYAERSEMTEAFDLMLTKSPNLNHKDKNGNTVILKAAMAGRTYHVKKLMEIGADIHVLNQSGENLISCLLTYYSTNKALIIELMEKGLKPDIKAYNGKTLAYCAIEHGDMDVLQLLKSKGISTDGRSISGERPGTRNKEIIKFVIENGGDINAKDNWGSGYLCAALEMNDLELASFLIGYKADVNGSCGHWGNVLMQAIDKGNLEFVQFLVESNASLTTQDSFRKNSLERAIEEGDERIIAYLRSKGALTAEELNQREVERVKEMQALPGLILSQNVVEILRLLNKYPETILLPEDIKKLGNIAAASGSIELLKMCLENYSINVNEAINFEEQTMLHLACKSNQRDLVFLLIKKGADISLEDGFGKTADKYTSNKEIKDHFKLLRAKKK